MERLISTRAAGFVSPVGARARRMVFAPAHHAECGMNGCG
jgi:hypothetical protein